MSSPVVEFRAVSKSYPIYSKPSARLKELALLNRRSFHTDFWALRDISFEIYPGETFCVVGENGSGKSTLLQMVAGILHPTSGDVRVRGRVAALLELGTGFNPEFSGRDNVYVNAAILGLSHKEIDAKFRQIEEFAEIGDVHRSAREDLLQRHGGPPGIRRRDPCRSRNPSGRRSPRSRRHVFPPALPPQSSRTAAATA